MLNLVNFFDFFFQFCISLTCIGIFDRSREGEKGIETGKERKRDIIKYNFLESLIYMYLVASICELVDIREVGCIIVVPVMSSDFRCSEKSGILWNSIGIHKTISKTFRKNSPL